MSAKDGPFSRYRPYLEASRESRERSASISKHISGLDPVDREIGKLMQRQLRYDERSKEIDQLREIVSSASPEEAGRLRESYGERVSSAFGAAVAGGTFSELERLERELRRAGEEEEFLMLAMMAL